MVTLIIGAMDTCYAQNLLAGNNQRVNESIRSGIIYELHLIYRQVADVSDN